MHVGLQHVTVRLGSDRFSAAAFFFFERGSPCLHHQRVDLPEQFLIDVTDILRKRFVVERLLLPAEHWLQTQNLAQQTIVVGQMLQSIIVTVQP